MTDLKATAFHWGAGWARVVDGVIEEIVPYEHDPEPSPIMAGVVDGVTSSMRVARPSIRTGFLNGPGDGGAGRGEDEYVEVGWDEAIALAASHLDRVRTEHGNEAIFGGSYGWSSAGRFHHAQSQVHRFLNSIGGYTRHVDNYSFAAAMVVIPHVVGDFWRMQADQNPWTMIAEHTDLVVAFGGVNSRAMQIVQGGVGRHSLPGMVRDAETEGTEFVNFSPLRSDLDLALGSAWMPLRPGSDTAVMLGLAHTLIVEDLHDRSFLASHTVGYEAIERYVMGRDDGVEKTAEWAAQLSGLDAEDLRQLARRMASSRTLITAAVGVQRAEHGEQPMWMAVVLAALLGQIGLPGGGFGIGYAQDGSIGRPNHRLPWPTLPQGTNKVDTFIPVSRIADLLLNPGQTYTYNGHDLTYPDIRLVYWAGGNPFHHHQDLNRLREAFRRPEVVIVNEPFWTATARHADIVFPATTPLERNDWAMAPKEQEIVAMAQVVTPVGQARNDYDIFGALAEQLGSHEAFTEGRDEEAWLEHLWEQAQQRVEPRGVNLPSYEVARKQGIVGLPSPTTAKHVMLADYRADPAAHPLGTPSGKLELFSTTIASFGYTDCPGHPIWIEPSEWLGKAARDPAELHLISNQPATRLHSQYDAGATSTASKIRGREALTMHPDDAIHRGLAAGDLVRVHNERGAFVAGLAISESVMAGVVQIATGATYDPWVHPEFGPICLHGNPNTVTRDVGTSSLAQGPSSSTTLVRVDKLDGDIPDVRSFEPPLVPRV